MCDNYNVIMKAVSGYGLCLRHASERLQANRDIVMAAVTEWGMALNFAASHLRGDRELVMRAVSNDGASLMYACEELKEELFDFAVTMHGTLIGMRINLMSGRQAILVLDSGPGLSSWMIQSSHACYLHEEQHDPNDCFQTCEQACSCLSRLLSEQAEKQN